MYIMAQRFPLQAVFVHISPLNKHFAILTDNIWEKLSTLAGAILES
jgi:hypothetical protein